jgi:ElaB/YqjD/DUF883 family membrane-anchored ribosome-binding protein
MGERDDARHQVEQTRARMTAMAHEVSRRMTPRYAKERATEMARERAMQTRDRAVDNPWLVPLIGAGIGVLAGRALVSRAQDAREREWERRGRHWYPGDRRGIQYGAEDYGYETYGEAWRDDEARSAGFIESTELASGEEGRSMRERASDAASDVKERVAGTASEVKERVAGTAAEVKERVGEKAGEYGQRMREGAQHLRERIPDAERIRERAREQPGLWALGAMALGALFGFAVPISERERRALEPAREKAREAGEQALDKLDKAMSRAESAVGEGEHRREEPRVETAAPSSPATLGTLAEPHHDPLH